MIIVGDATGNEVIEMVPTMQSWIDLIEQQSIIRGHQHMTRRRQGTIVKTKQGMYQHLRIPTRGGRPNKLVQRIKKQNQDQEVGLHRRREAHPADHPLGN